MPDTLCGYLEQWANQCPDKLWLEDRQGDQFTRWSWQQAHEEIQALGAWLEGKFGANSKTNIGILSRNRAHWILADMAIVASGNVTVPMFTTLPNETAAYVMEFTEMELIFVGESDNWGNFQAILPASVQLIALPGVELEQEHLRWEDLLEEYRGQTTTHIPSADELISLVFTSGTTGVPKGVMQTHTSNVLPTQRFLDFFNLGNDPKFISYLPLSHIAERQLVEAASLVTGGQVNFNENLTTLLRDLAYTKPAFFFGPPRVWEQIQQIVVAEFGSQAALDKALATDKEGISEKVRGLLGMDKSRYLLTAAAPIPPALIEWFGELGLPIMEGFGQTEAMGLTANTRDARKVGSIGRASGDVDVRVSEEGELQVKAPGLSPGYYKQPDKTAETFVDGWVFTGDKCYIDDDGFVFITGRVKDYFKTIQGKFVAPPPIEAAFSDNVHTEQQCLLGRGYSKTVMVCVLSSLAQTLPREQVQQELLAVVARVNNEIEKHARIGALIVSRDLWSIENAMLTPTMKIRREQVEKAFGEKAMELAREGAEQGVVVVHWH